MKPNEFWSLTLAELLDVAEAVMKDEKDKFDIEHQLLAWQTALLMNATGNYKKQIKPEMLLGKKPDEEDEVVSSGSYTRVDRDEKNRKLDELKNKFKQAT